MKPIINTKHSYELELRRLGALRERVSYHARNAAEAAALAWRYDFRSHVSHDAEAEYDVWASRDGSSSPLPFRAAALEKALADSRGGYASPFDEPADLERGPTNAELDAIARDPQYIAWLRSHAIEAGT